MNLDDNQDQLVREWTEYFTEEVLSYSRPAEVSNEEVFSDVYHALIHSSMSETLLQLEHSHAEVIAEKCNEKDIEMTKLDERQAKEMSAAVERTEKGKIDIANHLELGEMIESFDCSYL